MARDDKTGDLKGPLMSDEAFAEFMEAKFTKDNSITNDIEKEKTWNAISAKIDKPVVKQQWLNFASVAVLILAILPVFFISTEHDVTRVKGVEQTINASLDVFKVAKDGNLIAIKNSIDVGDTLVFKTLLDSDAVVALAYMKNNEEPDIRFISEPLSAGIPLILEREKRTYGYSVEQGDKSLKFCLIGASSIDNLEMKINELQNKTSSFADLSCKTLKIH